jgi:hypothetical protein
MAKRENPYLLIIHPETRRDYATTPEGFELNDYGAQGYRVDRYQDGRKYDGPLPKVTPAQREKLGLPEPTPEGKTVAGVEARRAARASGKKKTEEEAPEEPVVTEES